MMYMGLGFAGLGAGLGYDDSTMCSDIPAGDPYRTPGNYCTQYSGNVIEFNADGSVDADPFGAVTGSSSTPAVGSGNPGGSATSWWQSALTSLTTGVTRGLTTPSPTMPVVPAVPWYATPGGILGIVAAVAGGVYLLTRK